MKIIRKKQHTFGTILLLTTLLVGTMFQSCEEYPHEYQITEGLPTIDYIRITDPASSDSLIVRASLNNTITLVGENLTSITEMWFNDKEAYLNTSFITSNNLIVTIPNEIPGIVTDKIYMIAGSDTITHDFNVIVPPPAPRSMVCEFVADGEEAIIKGSYFIDDPNVPLEVLFPGNVAGEVVSVSKKFDEVVVKVPAGAGVGPVTVKSIYGAARSTFYFRDDRNYILDWDNLDAAGGWRSGVIGNADPAGVNGNYVRFQGDMTADGGSWNEDAFSFNLWNAANGREDVPFYDGDLSSAVLKFECNVLTEWKAASLQMIFTPFSTSATNGYIGDDNFQRGLWTPWASTGSYQTDGWVTVSIPMTEFHYSKLGADLGTNVTTEMLGGLTFFVWSGGVTGADCSIHMCIDNIRIVPN